MNERQKNNLEICEKLKKYFHENPDIRFFQGLWNTGIVQWTSTAGGIIRDKYEEESIETNKKIKYE